MGQNCKKMKLFSVALLAASAYAANGGHGGDHDNGHDGDDHDDGHDDGNDGNDMDADVGNKATKRVDRILRQIGDLVDVYSDPENENAVWDEDFAYAAKAQAMDLGDKLKNVWQKKYVRCNWGPAEEDAEDAEMDRNRYDPNDPCLASHQLTRSLARFANRFDKKARNFGNKMMRKAKCPKPVEEEET